MVVRRDSGGENLLATTETEITEKGNKCFMFPTILSDHVVTKKMTEKTDHNKYS